jgi:hypothetical protein
MIALLALIIALPMNDTTVTGVVRSSIELFASARSLSVAPNGDVYCLDGSRHTVYRISPDGTVKNSVGGQGWGQHEFEAPSDVSSTFFLEVLVTDRNNRRIQRFDGALQFADSFEESTLPRSVGSFHPRASAMSKHGDLFIIETDGRRILKLNRRNQMEREFGTFKEGAGALVQPIDIALSVADEVVVLDKGRIVVYDYFGNLLRVIDLNGTGWSSITAVDSRFIVTSAGHIVMLSSDGRYRRRLEKSTIIGLPSDAEIVDAGMYDNHLYVLTTIGLYRCSLH